MAKFKTNIIKPFKVQGGTFCAFASAMEDIGLNINEKSNKVRLSHYAVLDIPNCDYTNQNPNKNVLNLLTPPDAFNKSLNTINEELTNDSSNFFVRRNIAQSFMSYALNMESVIRNNNTTNSYDFTRNLTISERVFWKWLKETGAINWQKYDEDYYVEMPNENGYERVVKSFGAIDAVAQRSSDYGMYNEIYVNIPTSFGGIQNILFKQIEDDNYSFDKIYETNNVNVLENHSNESINTSNTSLSPIPYFDYSSSIEENISHKNNNEDGFWFKNITLTEGREIGCYITDKKVKNDETLYDEIKVDTSTLSFVINRSKLDCMSLELNLNKLNSNSYDELNIDTSINNYTFNTLLIFYSIYDNNDNILATNLYGVYFIDTPTQLGDILYNENFINFEIPRLTKKKSTIDGFGTSYSFRFNIRASSLFDGENDIIYDNASSENSIVNDFNDVVTNLNRTINLLSRNVKSISVIQEKYNDLNQKYDNLYNNFIKLTQRIQNLENNSKM